VLVQALEPGLEPGLGHFCLRARSLHRRRHRHPKWKRKRTWEHLPPLLLLLVLVLVQQQVLVQVLVQEQVQTYHQKAPPLSRPRRRCQQREKR